MRLYTKQGDDGRTGLIGGGRVEKDSTRVAAYGHVDELNACMGLVRCATLSEPLPDRVSAIQNLLFEMGAYLATPKSGVETEFKPRAAPIATLETWIDEASDAVPPLRQFVLPGGTEASARLHLARTVCRRAERAVVTLMREEKMGPTVVICLNRLSDLLFAWARYANHAAGADDVPWTPPAD